MGDKRAAAVGAACERQGIRLGLHTAAAVNVAEYAPYVDDAVERYLEAYVGAAVRLGAGWIVVHAGFHFPSDREQRMQAGRERLRRVVDYAQRKGARVPPPKPYKEAAQAAVHSPSPTAPERGRSL